MQSFLSSQTRLYIIGQPDAYILIDSGIQNDFDNITKKLSLKGFDWANCTHLILTHHHNDHAGNLCEIKQANPEIIFVMTSTCAKLLLEGQNQMSSQECFSHPNVEFVTRLYKRINRKIGSSYLPYTLAQNDVTINSDKDFVFNTHVSGRLITTPGHTSDCLSLISGDTAYIGDAARNMLNFLGAPYQPLIIQDREMVMKSWEKILSYNIGRICPSHGHPFSALDLKNNL